VSAFDRKEANMVNSGESNPASKSTRGLKGLDHHERIIEKASGSFIEEGDALREIRDRQLYGPEHDNFDAYCLNRWGYTSRYARYHIDAAPIGRLLREGGTIVPLDQARALIRLASEPETAVKVYEDLRTRFGRPPVARELATEVKSLLALRSATSDDPQAQLVKEYRLRAQRAVHRIEAAMTEVIYSLRGMHQADRDGFPTFVSDVAESLRKSGFPDIGNADWWRPLLDLGGAGGPFEEVAEDVHDQERLLRHQAKEAASRTTKTKRRDPRRLGM
jgi:hypothetical protein